MRGISVLFFIVLEYLLLKEAQGLEDDWGKKADKRISVLSGNLKLAHKRIKDC